MTRSIMRRFFLNALIVAVALWATRTLPAGKRLQWAIGAFRLQSQLTARCRDVIALFAAKGGDYTVLPQDGLKFFLPLARRT